MESRITEIAQRIKGTREILEYSVEEMAAATEVTPEEYVELESGNSDFTFTFLFKCAEKFGIDMIELMSGDQPKLSFYEVVRAGGGLPIARRKGFGYRHLAHLFKDKLAEPFLVTAPYSEAEQDAPIRLSRHEGQEFNYVIRGALKVAMENHIEILREGDSIYYDSGHAHGMVATEGEECVFLSIILKKNN